MRYYLIEVIIQQLYYTFSTIFINYSLQCTFIAMLEVTIVMTPIKAVVKNTRYFTAFYDLNLSYVTDKMDSNKPSFGSVSYKQNVTLSKTAKDHFRTTLPV